jgi:uncharacterized protein YciI
VPAFLVTRTGRAPLGSVPAARRTVRLAAHAAFMDALVEQGFTVLGGRLAGEHRVVHAVEADSEEAVRSTLARDPWSETHLRVAAIEPWTLRLDARRR